MLQLKIDVFLYMSLLLYTTESCTSEDNISGIQFDNQFTTVHIYQNRTVYHFEVQSDSSDKVLFSTYGNISVSDGISGSSLSNAELIAGGPYIQGGYKEGIGDHAQFRGITDFCQNGTHIIVVDKWNHCIRSIYYGNSNKSTAKFAGRCGNLGYIDSDASSALFDQPHSILIMKSGNNFLYLVTDTGNNAIRLIDTGNGEVTTFVNASVHLMEPIDLIFSQDLSSLYVTTRSGLTMVDIRTRRMSLIQGSSNFGRLFKMAWLTNDTYLITDRFDNKLIVLTANGQNFGFEPICCQVTKSGEGNVSSCDLNQPYSVFFSRENCAIIVGAHKRIHQLNVYGDICNSTNSAWKIPNRTLTIPTVATTTPTTTHSTTTAATSTTTTPSTTTAATTPTTIPSTTTAATIPTTIPSTTTAATNPTITPSTTTAATSTTTTTPSTTTAATTPSTTTAATSTATIFSTTIAATSTTTTASTTTDATSTTTTPSTTTTAITPATTSSTTTTTDATATTTTPSTTTDATGTTTIPSTATTATTSSTTTAATSTTTTSSTTTDATSTTTITSTTPSTTTDAIGTTTTPSTTATATTPATTSSTTTAATSTTTIPSTTTDATSTTTTSSTTTDATSTNTTTKSSTIATPTVRDISASTSNKAEITTINGLEEQYGTHLFIIYGLVGFVTMLLLAIFAVLCRRASRRSTHNTRHLVDIGRWMNRPLPVRPGVPSPITTIGTYHDDIPLRNFGISSESRTYTNRSYNMSNESPQIPMHPSNTDGYTPMCPNRINPEPEYTPLQVYNNNQPEAINTSLLNDFD